MQRTKSRDNGGRAFPHREYYGMTLADWFAGRIISGAHVEADVEGQAREVYRLATAMARAKRVVDGATAAALEQAARCGRDYLDDWSFDLRIEAAEEDAIDRCIDALRERHPEAATV